MKSYVLAGLIAVAVFDTARSQVSFSGATLSYSQNFDSLGQANVSWTDNSTLPGWYLAAKSATFGSSGIPTTLITNMASTSGNAFNMGTMTGGSGVNPSTDRALGWLPASNTSDTYTGFQLQNNSGSGFVGTVEYTFYIEQWSATTTGTPRVININAGTFATAGNILQSTGGWNLLTTLSPPIAGNVGQLDGNSPANRVAEDLTMTFTEASPWLAGQYLWLQVVDKEGTGGNDKLAIDDFTATITPVPEPAVCSLVGFGGLFSLCMLRRRKLFHV